MAGGARLLNSRFRNSVQMSQQRCLAFACRSNRRVLEDQLAAAGNQARLCVRAAKVDAQKIPRCFTPVEFVFDRGNKAAGDLMRTRNRAADNDGEGPGADGGARLFVRADSSLGDDRNRNCIDELRNELRLETGDQPGFVPYIRASWKARNRRPR